MANKGRNINNEELSLWTRFIEGINPLKNRDIVSPSKSEIEINHVEKQGRRNFASSTVSPPASPQTFYPSSQNNLDRKTLQKIQSGKAKIEGKIDLHGMNQDQAKHALHDFIAASFHQGKRCVLVVTGKGGRHKNTEDMFSSIPDGQGILKTRFQEWVQRPPLNRYVLRHDPAIQHHGGGGAFYVYLKKNKLH